MSGHWDSPASSSFADDSTLYQLYRSQSGCDVCFFGHITASFDERFGLKSASNIVVFNLVKNN